MGERRFIALILSGLFLMSVLPSSLLASFEPLQQADENSFEGISDGHISALESLPSSVKVSGRTGDSTTPSWGWAVNAGGSDYDNGIGIAVDSNGNAYVTGSFRGTATFGNTSLTSNGGYDIFIAKLSSSGSWQWAVKADGSQNGSGIGIAVDLSGNSYVTGSFNGTVTFGSTSLTSSEYEDIFIAKLSSSGSWQWAYKAGGLGGSGFGRGIALDSSDNVYVTGEWQGPGTATFGSTSLMGGGLYASIIFITKLSSSGSWLWAVKADGSYSGSGYGITVDSDGDAYVTGYFWGTAIFGSTSLTSSDDSLDIFIAKLSSSSSWLWAVKAGSSSYDIGNGIAIDSSDNVYVTGYFRGGATFGSSSLTSSGNSDIFIAKLSSSNGSWQWAVNAGGSSNDIGNGIAVDSSGNSYTTGYFSETATFGSTSLTSSGLVDDIFIAKLNSSGSWQWAVKAGGDPDGYNRGNGIAVDSSGNPYVTGHFYQTATFGSISLESNGGYDIFIAIHYDRDGDGILNDRDRCSDGAIDWKSNINSDYDADGCQDYGEDDDDDDDGITDDLDDCEKGNLGWTSSSSTDHDSDGCQDSNEDNDDDNDGIFDTSDNCEKGDLGWTLNPSTDYDYDGCQDSIEDMDDDDDGIPDTSDSCQKGANWWTSGISTDYDSDGCQDSGEDDDDDDDDISDGSDDCPKGTLGWISNPLTDHDDDGCSDSIEDMDDDNDGILDSNDACQKGTLGWTSDFSTDYDSDGCQDSGEDDDDDNDGLTDELDYCSFGNSSWSSISSTDHDSDGCQDIDEDNDDDNDRVPDLVDLCPHGQLGWFSSKSTDYDSDGCLDSSEDVDDDNDGVLDAIEINAGTDSLDASSKPIESFSLVVGNIELSTWDLIGIVLATLTSGFLIFSFVTRKGRYDAFSLDINDAQDSSLGKLEKKLELASFFRLLSPRQSIKLESLLDNKKEDLGTKKQLDVSVTFPNEVSSTPPDLEQPPMNTQTGVLDGKGYEWIKREDGDWYRVANSGSEYECLFP